MEKCETCGEEAKYIIDSWVRAADTGEIIEGFWYKCCKKHAAEFAPTPGFWRLGGSPPGYPGSHPNVVKRLG